MNWLGALSLAAYCSGLAFSGAVTWRLVTGTWNPATAKQAGQALVPGALICGFALSSAATPDWNPFTMFALWLPYVAIATWALFYSWNISRGLERRVSARRALLWALPLALFAPPAISSIVSGFGLG